MRSGCGADAVLARPACRGAAPWQRGDHIRTIRGMAELRRSGEHDIPVLGQLAVLYPEQVVERGWLPVQQALALGEDELPVRYDAVDPVDHCLPYAGLDRLAKPADPVGDVRIVLNEPVIGEEAADLCPIPAIMISSAKLATISLDAVSPVVRSRRRDQGWPALRKGYRGVASGSRTIGVPRWTAGARSGLGG